ncbi:MAG: hypothetical protein HC830_11625 [Bacteroidetes bacterium]|nr:hypothetical protein [Bacteroidota bacterium]
MTLFPKYIFFILVIAVIYSCRPSSEYPGYSMLENGNYYKLLKIGESETKCKTGDFVIADITYKTINDSVFFREEENSR